jgi:hypothetical protein
MTSDEDPNDVGHFLRAIGEIRRLEHDQAEVPPPPPAPLARKRR